ncbi:MAG: carboxypeptidase-like regulatory domain-containing protein, partial [Gemmatimonadaceae bacterium]|nr:carboxypeptidase-like regulatory domain-containing protein [Gemmatimonadaceae bacterium]
EGATVEIVDSQAGGRPRTVVTDEFGRFRFTGLAPGRLLVGFFHETLTVLGLEEPTRSIEVGGDTIATVDLFIPSSTTIRLLRCGASLHESSAGMMVGYVHDAKQHTAVRDAAVRLSWRALALDAGNYRTVNEVVTATIEADGSYLACHVPVDVALGLLVTAPGYRTIEGSVALVSAKGVARMDIALVDSALASGTGVIRGRVTRESGNRVASGVARIAALGREVPIRDGNFVLGDLPVGSWVLESRVIGTQSQMSLLTASEHTSAPAEINVGEALQTLEAVTILGVRDANTRRLEDILRRKRLGMGTVFLPDSPALKSATFTSDVMKEARGFIYQGPNRILGRVSLSSRGGGRCANIAVFVDDMLQPYGFEGLDAVAPPSDVLAIETYPDIVLAPVQYRIAKTAIPARGAQSREVYCAVVLIWTKH